MKALARIAAFALAALPVAAFAQTAPRMSREAELIVTGNGTISRPADQATFSLNITTTDDAAATSTSRNNATYNAVHAKLVAAGVADAAIKTRGYNVQYVPRPAKPPQNDFGQRYGYTTNRYLDVQTSVDGLGRAIDAAVAGGATDISNVQFGLKNRKGAYNEALAAAVADARSQADALATAAGVKIVRIRTISSTAFSAARPMMARMALASADAAPVPTQISPDGPIDVTASVTISYVIQ